MDTSFLPPQRTTGLLIEFRDSVGAADIQTLGLYLMVNFRGFSCLKISFYIYMCLVIVEDGQ
jgi:hypothetical protein